MQGRADRHPRIRPNGSGGSALCAAHTQQRQMVRFRYRHRSMPERFHIRNDYRTGNVVRNGLHQQCPQPLYSANHGKHNTTRVRNLFLPEQPDEKDARKQKEH